MSIAAPDGGALYVDATPDGGCCFIDIDQLLNSPNQSTPCARSP